MRELMDVQRQLLPDLIETLKKRYMILNTIMLSGTIGRRTLAASLDMTERVLRAEVDFLKAQGLLDTDSAGMQVSRTGRELLEQMEPLFNELFGLSDMEESIGRHFGLKQVVVIPGDWDTSPFTKKELGRAGALMLRKYALKDDVIAVAGGSTMAEVAEWLTPSEPMKGNWFVPARGGLGESVELQANMIASTMAKKTGGQYRLLHVPDHLSDEAYQSLIQEPNIREVVDVIRNARVVLHGIGNALHMAKRRRADESTIRLLQDEYARGEAFGYYFDAKGQIVHKMPTLGLRLEDIHQMDTVIAVAGGKSKGEAIAAVLQHGHEDVLVTDEAAGNEILKLI
ncbi:sugar-binding transcriptional regulator [Ferviditalea candida]|uniref:Sugar-binding domain-containing protein n=1 Tax=Ferviditalea candida TaxID=3108399 RepID=A0ABU5ZKZ3_9BACL|nr:sugar-binding domain-containing protein [Paenibacillaceae bacterium T2]